MNARTRRRMSSISGESVKSICVPLAPGPSLTLDLYHLAAIDDDGRAGHVGAGVRRQQPQRSTEIALIAEASLRHLALDLRARFAVEVSIVHLGLEPAGRDRVHAEPRE